MTDPSSVDLKNLERIATFGITSFGVLTGSLMQYNAFLLAAFSVIASTSKLSSCIFVAYLSLATVSLLLPLLSAIIFHNGLRRQADGEIKRLYKATPEIFANQSDNFKKRHSQEKTSDPDRDNKTPWVVQEISIYATIFNTVALYAIALVQYAQ